MCSMTGHDRGTGTPTLELSCQCEEGWRGDYWEGAQLLLWPLLPLCVLSSSLHDYSRALQGPCSSAALLLQVWAGT